MREIIHVPTFRSIEEAKMFAERNEPLKKSMEFFHNEAVYYRYGEAAKTAAMKGWEAAVKGDMTEMVKQTKLLSRALPAFVFDYEGRR